MVSAYLQHFTYAGLLAVLILCGMGLPLPEDAAGAVAYLLGPDGARITGAVITVDGGSTA